MLIVSNYPQVPLATTNVATDSARVDNQLKPIVVPPQAATKGHEERAFNPQHERSADQFQQARLLEQNQQQVQDKQQQQQSSQQQSQQQAQKAPEVVSNTTASKTLKLITRGPAALQRKDIRIKAEQAGDSPKTAPKLNNTSLPTPSESPQFYQQFGQRIGQFYNQQTQPESKPAMSAWV